MEKGIIMRNKWIVCILLLALFTGLAVNTSIAGGGGSCSGEDEKQCLAVVFGTAAVLIIGVYLVSKYAEDKKSAASGMQPGGKAAPSTYNDLALLEEKQIEASAFALKDRVARNGDIILWKW